MRAVYHALNVCFLLTEVYFDNEALSLLKVFLLENKTVNTLEISCNILKCDGLNRVSEGLANDTLTTLVLRSNFVNVSDISNVMPFANYLCRSKSLMTLCVRDNNICGGDARLIMNVLAFNASLTSLTIKGKRPFLHVWCVVLCCARPSHSMLLYFSLSFFLSVFPHLV